MVLSAAPKLPARRSLGRSLTETPAGSGRNLGYFVIPRGSRLLVRRVPILTSSSPPAPTLRGRGNKFRTGRRSDLQMHTRQGSLVWWQLKAFGYLVLMCIRTVEAGQLRLHRFCFAVDLCCTVPTRVELLKAWTPSRALWAEAGRCAPRERLPAAGARRTEPACAPRGSLSMKVQGSQRRRHA